MTDCLFCRIVQGQESATILYTDDHSIVFEDIYPKAPRHLLYIPKEHIQSLNDVQPRHAEILGQMMINLKNIARDIGQLTSFKTLSNTGRDAGQVIDHLHFHIMGSPKEK